MNKTKNNFINPLLMGVGVWYFLLRKPKKTGTLIVGDYEPIGVGLDYQSQFFKDSEYFGQNSIPNDFYFNWLKLVKELDKIRVAFGTPILIRKGFNVKEPLFATCRAVEIHPQNNNIDQLNIVIGAIFSELNISNFLLASKNNNAYIQIS